MPQNSCAAESFTCPADVVTAARELIRAEGEGFAVGIGPLLLDLSDMFSGKFQVTPQMHQLLDLIEKLWRDPHIDPVSDCAYVEFAWNEVGLPNREVGSNRNLPPLRERLLGHKPADDGD